MLVVFQESSKDILAQSLGIATWYNDHRNEDYNYCIAREKAQEVLACRELGVPYVVISKLQKDNRVIDTNVDLKALPVDTTLVLRCHHEAVMPKALAGFAQWLTAQEYARVLNWPHYISQPDHFLKRFVMPIERDLFTQIVHSRSLSFPVFIKTMEKSDFHQVISDADELGAFFTTVEQARKLHPSKTAAFEGLYEDTVVLINKREDWYCPYREQMIAGRVTVNTLDSGVIVSDVMAIEQAPSHKGEYRGYFINGQLSSLSAYLDYEHTDVPVEIETFAREFGQSHASLAKAFVADFCMTQNGPALVEMNDFGYSGRYIDNDARTLYTDLKRHFGDLEVIFINPLVRVPSLANTQRPDEEDVEIDFGMTSELIFSDNDVLVAKQNPDEKPGYMARFEKSQEEIRITTIDTEPMTGTEFGG